MIKTRINKVTEIENNISEIDLTFLNQSSRFIMPISSNTVTEVAPNSVIKPIVNYLSYTSPVNIIDTADNTTLFTYKCNNLQFVLNADIIAQFEKLLKHENAFMTMISKSSHIDYFIGIHYCQELTTDLQKREEISNWSYYQVTDILRSILTYE